MGIRHPALLILGLVTAALSGCVDYEERIELNPDGKTGMLKMHLVVDERFVAIDWPKPTSPDQVGTIESVFPTTLENLRKELDCPAVELVDARASFSTPMRHLYLVCRIKDAGKLNDSPALAHRKFILSQDAPTSWTFQQQLDINGTNMLGSSPEQTAKALARLEAASGRDRVRGMLAKYHLTFSVSLAGDYAARSSDGTIHRGGTVIWQKSLIQLFDSKEPWKMEARFAKEK